MIGQETIISLHRRILEQIYHEDQQLAQRTSNFFTVNAILAAVLALGISERGPAGFHYVVIGFGLTLAFLEIPLGRRTERAIKFWRAYLKLIETKWSIEHDHLLYDFFDYGEITTSSGKVVTAKPKKKPMYRTFPWKWIRSTNTLVGVVFPFLISIFWLSLLVVFSCRDMQGLALVPAWLVWVAILILLISLFSLVSWITVPAEPEAVPPG